MVWKYLSQVLQRTFMIGCYISPIDRDIYRKEDVYERILYNFYRYYFNFFSYLQIHN